MKTALALLFAAALALPAAAHPHKTDTPDHDAHEPAEPKTYSWDGEELREAARELEEALQDSDVITDLADMLAGFAANVEVERDEADGTALRFDGRELLRLNRDKTRNSEDRLSITGLGRNMTLERETVVVDGQSKTRIVIEMDGGDDVQIELPALQKD